MKSSGLWARTAGEQQHHNRVHIQLGQLGDARLVGHELLQPISREHLVGIDIEGDDGARVPPRGPCSPPRR